MSRRRLLLAGLAAALAALAACGRKGPLEHPKKPDRKPKPQRSGG